MKRKITLTIDKNILEKAEQFASENNLSVEELIENFLSEIAEKQQGEPLQISPLVKSISSKSPLPVDFDYKKEYREYLKEKYR
jgi:hypothetical protein